MRGIVPSLGAGASLIAAALCAAAFVGGMLAFRGPPSGTAEGQAGTVTVPDARDRSRTSRRHVAARRRVAGRATPHGPARRLATGPVPLPEPVRGPVQAVLDGLLPQP